MAADRRQVRGDGAEGARALAAFSLILLRSGERVLLLERSREKRFAPGRWTGLGGRVEAGEFEDLPGAALRELTEETGLRPEQVQRFTLRRALLHNRPGVPLTVLLAFTGELPALVAPACPEGTLHWVRPQEFDRVDFIDNAGALIPLLVEDCARDPDGRDPPVVGAARYERDGTLAAIVWA